MSCEIKASPVQTSVYSNADANRIMAHVQKHFGTVCGIGKARLSTGRVLDILAVSPPSRKHIGRLFSAGDAPSAGEETLLITFGAGACPMSVPKDSELPPRAEYLIRLPADWNVQSEEENDAWPAHLLMNIASLPEAEQSYNAWGHTFSFSQGTPFAENTRLCAAMLTGMNDREGQCPLTDGEAVTFYEVIPLYAEEMDFASEHGPVALIDEFIRYSIPRVVMRDRPDVALLVKNKDSLLKKFHSLSNAELKRMLQGAEALSQEERVAVTEMLHARTGVGQRALGLMKGVVNTFFKR